MTWLQIRLNVSWRTGTSRASATDRRTGRVQTYAIAGSSTGQRAHSLSVGHVESFQPDFQRVPALTAPWQRKFLCQPHVEGHVARQTQSVALPGLAGSRVSQALIDTIGIAAEKLRRRGATTVRSRLERRNSNRVALDVPVRRPTSIVKRGADRESGIPTEDTAQGPAAHCGIDPLVDV